MEEYLSKIKRSSKQIEFHQTCVNAIKSRTNIVGSFIRRGGKTTLMSTFALAIALSGPEKKVVLYSNQPLATINLIEKFAEQIGVSDRIDYDKDNYILNIIDDSGTHKSTIKVLHEKYEDPMEADVFLFDLAIDDPQYKNFNIFMQYYASRNTPMIGMTTFIQKQENYFRELRSNDDTPLFEIKKYTLACDECIGTNQILKCTHNVLAWGGYSLSLDADKKTELVNKILCPV